MDGLSIGVLSEKQEKQLENHEVYNLISDESEPERELIPIHSYISSSSPESGIGISNPSNIEIIKENTSLEIEAPFYEDDLNKSGISITFDDTEFSSQEKVSEQKKNVRILDGILSQDSYSFYKDDSEGSTEISGHDLKYLAKKWRSASQDITTSKTLKSNLKNTKQKKYLISQELQGCNIFNCSSQEKLSSQQSLNILSEFPLSSPVQRNDSEDDSKRMLFKKSFPADKIIQTENTLKKGKCVELKDPNKHSIPDETGALGLSRRLETGDETSISDTPSKLKKILTDTSKVIKDDLLINLIMESNSIQKATSIFKKSKPNNDHLKQYIVRGKCYSKEESALLVQQFLSQNKETFKKVNQTLRDNEKARSSIILEMPSHVISLFEKECVNIKTLLAPAILQASYDDSVPLIRFLRRSESIYDFNNDIYYPCDMKIVDENIYLLYYDAFEFFERYRKEKVTLFREVRSYSKTNKHVILILNNLNKLRKDLESLENTIYKARVDEQLLGSPKKQNLNKKLENIKQLQMGKDDLELRIRHIDRSWKVKIHTVNSHSEFLNSLPNLVSLVGKQHNDPSIRFIKYAHLNVRSGKDKKDVLSKVLNHIGRMPELKVEKVVKAYPSFQSLHGDFNKRQLKSGLDGQHIMSEAMEKRLYKLFTCTDPDQPIE